MEWLTRIFNSPHTPWIISSGLFIVTATVAYRWWLHGRRLETVIQTIRSAAGLSSALAIKEEKTRWQHYASEKFEAAQEELSQLSEDEPLARQTCAFLRRCEPVQNEGSDRVRLETSVVPADVIRLSDHMMENNVQLLLFRAFPNYLVGVGLCITFLGLAVVIGNASLVITPGTDGDSSLALRDLLVAASSKFWSSLTAVLLSVLYGIWLRNRSQQMERVVGLLARDLGRCVRVVSADELHYESIQLLRKLEGYQSATANQMGLLVTGLNHTQSTCADQHRILCEKLEAFSAGLGGKLGQLGDDLGSKMGSVGGQVAESLSQVNEKAFSEIAQQMTKGLHKATEVHLKSVTERLEAVSKALANLPEEFNALVGLVQKNTTSIADAFTTAVKPIETSLAAASNSAQEVALKFATLPDALEPARSAAKDLTSSANTISEMVARIHSQNETVVKRWEELSGLILTIDTHLAGAIESVGEVFPNYAEKLQEFSQEWQSAMVMALGGLSSNIKDLSSSHEELRVQRTVWQDSSGALSRSMDAMNANITRVTEALTTQRDIQQLPPGAEAASGKTSDKAPISNKTPA